MEIVLNALSESFIRFYIIPGACRTTSAVIRFRITLAALGLDKIDVELVDVRSDFAISAAHNDGVTFVPAIVRCRPLPKKHISLGFDDMHCVAETLELYDLSRTIACAFVNKNPPPLHPNIEAPLPLLFDFEQACRRILTDTIQALCGSPSQCFEELKYDDSFISSLANCLSIAISARLNALRNAPSETALIALCQQTLRALFQSLEEYHAITLDFITSLKALIDTAHTSHPLI